MTLNEIYAFKEELRTISMDFDNNHAMVKSNFAIVNFDKAKDVYAKEFGAYSPKSCDGLYYCAAEDTYYFVEFKNGKINNDVRLQVNLKVLESISLLSDVLNMPTSFFREKCTFILVFNDSKNRSSIGAHVMRNAGVELVRFGLDRLEKLYLKKVYTLNPWEFTSRFVRNWEKGSV
ncbi:MAG: hypothetical protein LBS21_07195 [Clostridiales bacterium]|jgi:hypothetical protein|nr:hypothetical protein [Clostridiales bacterium]